MSWYMTSPFNRERASKLMNAYGIDVLVASSPNNNYYATGYMSEDTFGGRNVQGASMMCLAVVPHIDEGEPFAVLPQYAEGEIEYARSWITDRRYCRPNFRILGREREIEPEENQVVALKKGLEEKALHKRKIGFEMGDISHDLFLRLTEALPEATLVDASRVFDELRAIKTDEEIRMVRKAIKATEKAIKAGFSGLREGITEIEVDNIVRKTLAAEGAEEKWSLVAIGSKGAWGARPTETSLKNGDLIKIDRGGAYKGYICDMARHRIFGKPSEKALSWHRLISKVNDDIFKAVKPGVTCDHIFEICEKAYHKAGASSTLSVAGHGVGLEPHEPPYLSKDNPETLKPGMVLAIETANRVVGVGGFNLEEMLLVTENGNEKLTTLSRELEMEKT